MVSFREKSHGGGGCHIPDFQAIKNSVKSEKFLFDNLFIKPLFVFRKAFEEDFCIKI